jgi:ribosomal protein L37AE/L43A
MPKQRHGKPNMEQDKTRTNQPKGLRKLQCAKCGGATAHRQAVGGSWVCVVCGETH